MQSCEGADKGNWFKESYNLRHSVKKHRGFYDTLLFGIVTGMATFSSDFLKNWIRDFL